MLVKASILFASLYILSYGPNCVADFPAHFLSEKRIWHLLVWKWSTEGH